VIKQAFRHFQYPTVPLGVSDDFMNTMLRGALTPALGPPQEQEA